MIVLLVYLTLSVCSCFKQDNTDKELRFLYSLFLIIWRFHGQWTIFGPDRDMYNVTMHVLTQAYYFKANTILTSKLTHNNFWKTWIDKRAEYNFL